MTLAIFLVLIILTFLSAAKILRATLEDSATSPSSVLCEGVKQTVL